MDSKKIGTALALVCALLCGSAAARQPVMEWAADGGLFSGSVPSIPASVSYMQFNASETAQCAQYALDEKTQIVLFGGEAGDGMRVERRGDGFALRSGSNDAKFVGLETVERYPGEVVLETKVLADASSRYNILLGSAQRVLTGPDGEYRTDWRAPFLAVNGCEVRLMGETPLCTMTAGEWYTLRLILYTAEPYVRAQALGGGKVWEQDQSLLRSGGNINEFPQFNLMNGTNRAGFVLRQTAPDGVQFAYLRVWQEEPANETVAAWRWCEPAVDTLRGAGVLTEGSYVAFAPWKEMTRGQYAANLAAALGLQAETETVFANLPADHPFADGILRAAKAGWILGEGSYLRPDDPLTREEAFVMAARALEGKLTPKPLTDFADAADVSLWAVEPLEKLVGSGLVKGDGNRLFPRQPFYKGEAAALLVRVREEAAR